MAALLATQPTMPGPRLAIVTTVGGWGVLAADTLATTDLRLAPIDAGLRTELDALLPPRWSKGNPIDLAGGETRDTVPAVLRVVAAHPDVDGVLLLGAGIQSNQGRFEREGGFHPDHGLARIVEFHERQDRRYVEAARECIDATGKPVVLATELAVADPTNAAVVACADNGLYCVPSADRAVLALAGARRARHRSDTGR